MASLNTAPVANKRSYGPEVPGHKAAIEQALVALEKALEELHSGVYSLEVEFGSVLSDDPHEGELASEVMCGTSPLTVRLWDVVTAVQCDIERLRAVTARSEL